MKSAAIPVKSEPVADAVLWCDCCNFLGLPRTLQLHQLLGCCNNIVDESNTRDSPQSPQQYSESLLVKTLRPCCVLLEKLPIAGGSKQPSWMHQLLDCCSKAPDTTKTSGQSPQQYSESLLVRTLQPCSVRLERLPITVGSGVESGTCDLCSFIGPPRTLRLHQLLGCCGVILVVDKPGSLDQKVDKLTRDGAKNKFKCKTCNYTCKYLSLLKSHIIIHSEERPFGCNVCSYRSALSSNLKRHNLSHTGEKPFSCKLCSYKCTSSYDLKRHNLQHTGHKPFSCKMCSFKCTYSSNLKQHNFTHTGNKPFSCKVCSFNCTQANNLKRHNLIHTGEKPFSCKVCSFKSTELRNLKLHNFTHTGSKPFSCNECSYKSAQLSNLKRHILSHTGEKPFSCKVCNYKCTRLNYLKQHNLTHPI